MPFGRTNRHGNSRLRPVYSVLGRRFQRSIGTAANTANWTYDTGNNFGNGEIDWATTDRANSYLDGNGDLVIVALNNSTPHNYTSAHLKTMGLHYAGPYGQIEVNIQPPWTQGIGAAFWTLGKNNSDGSGVPWPYCGEIDIMELHGGTGNEGNTSSTIHGYDVNNGDDYGTRGIPATYPLPGGQLQHNAFHNYGMYWMPFHIQFYEDGVIYSDLDVTVLDCNGTWPFNQPQMLIDSMGIGGQVAGNPDSTTIFPMYEYTNYLHENHWTAGAPAKPGTFDKNGIHQRRSTQLGRKRHIWRRLQYLQEYGQHVYIGRACIAGRLRHYEYQSPGWLTKTQYYVLFLGGCQQSGR